MPGRVFVEVFYSFALMSRACSIEYEVLPSGRTTKCSNEWPFMRENRRFARVCMYGISSLQDAAFKMLLSYDVQQNLVALVRSSLDST